MNEEEEEAMPLSVKLGPGFIVTLRVTKAEAKKIGELMKQNPTMELRDAAAKVLDQTSPKTTEQGFASK